MSIFRKLAAVGALLALIVIVMGAWVRLTDAGLGCPDWPGCYGAIIVPSSPAAVEAVNEAYPARPLEQGKAWREMVHRYAAGILGLLVLALAIIAIRNRREPGQPLILPLCLLGLIIFQALLGMWTVTLLLKPVVVMAHLLGGLTTLGLLAWLVLGPTVKYAGSLPTLAAIGLAVLGTQIALGGWTSANYAALVCPDLPTCQDHYWPEMDFGQGFVLWRGLGVNYEGGTLSGAARTAIHVTHRIGALVTTLMLAWLALVALRRNGTARVKWAGAAVALTLMAQVTLGIAIVKMALPLSLATAHNGMAALLLLSVIALNHAARSSGT